MDINQTVSLILGTKVISFQIVLATEAEKRLQSITWENKEKWGCEVIEQMLYVKISGTFQRSANRAVVEGPVLEYPCPPISATLQNKLQAYDTRALHF